MAKQVKRPQPNPVNNARWERLSPLARSMIEYIVHADDRWLRDFMLGKVIFDVHDRQVRGMTPAPDLKPGYGLPLRGRDHERNGSKENQEADLRPTKL